MVKTRLNNDNNKIKKTGFCDGMMMNVWGRCVMI